MHLQGCIELLSVTWMGTDEKVGTAHLADALDRHIVVCNMGL